MHLDHVSFAVGPDGLAGTTAELGRLLNATFVDGHAKWLRWDQTWLPSGKLDGPNLWNGGGSPAS